MRRFFQSLSTVALLGAALIASTGCQSQSPSGPGDRGRTAYLDAAPPIGDFAASHRMGATYDRAFQLPDAPMPRFPVAPVHRGAAPSIVGESAIVIDASTGKVLHEKNADTVRPVASTQKLLTALIIAEAGGLNDMVTVDVSDTRVEPIKMGINAGERYRKIDLLEAMLIRSGNDIAHCLARNYAGSESAFAEVMNRRARKLGMFHSHFRNASGLPAEGQYSTARDLTLLARAALRNPVIDTYVRRPGFTFHYANGTTKKFTTTNKLIERSAYCHGMKTGYTKSSGRCLVCAGTYRGRTIVVIVLKTGIDQVFIDAKQLLDWGLGVPT